MDAKEEQAQEIEVLQSIYPDELELLSDSAFTILLKIDPPAADSLIFRPETVQQAVVLRVEYSETYPETVPTLEVALTTLESDDDAGDDDDEDEKKKKAQQVEPPLLDSTDVAELQAKAEAEAEENVGLASVFAISSSLKDNAESALQAKYAAEQAAYDARAAAQEEIEQAKFRGTAVSRETFLEWRKRFRAEKDAERRAAGEFDDDGKRRPTGREIFEKGLAGSKAEDDELAAGTAALAVS
ncbi:RWD domain-containing protein [Dipodascopsis tothii]|uniref:RWD domain-containing protein n=1 Tax=Dipodascopsis tothii TaxID=44089 RepID=UPI0034CE4051